jgi:hypothetical protein
MRIFVQIILFSIMGMIFLTSASTVNAAGFTFNWKPFVIEKDFSADVVPEKSAIQDLSYFSVKENIFDVYLKTGDALEEDQGRPSETEAVNQALWKNIKIKLYASKKLMANAPEQRPDTEDKHLSDFLDAVTDLIYDDSKLKTLGNIGTLIEPQINFYFEF